MRKTTYKCAHSVEEMFEREKIHFQSIPYEENEKRIVFSPVACDAWQIETIMRIENFAKLIRFFTNWVISLIIN